MDLEIKEAMVAVVAGVPFGRQSLGTPSSDDAPQNAALNSDWWRVVFSTVTQEEVLRPEQPLDSESGDEADIGSIIIDKSSNSSRLIDI